LLRFINRFNDVSFWVANEVLAAKDKEAQAKLIGKFIKVAKKMWRKHSNFNGLMAIISGLGIHPIQRLTETWALVSDRKQELRNKMATLMSSMSNFKRYRDTLNSLVELPRIPYLAVILKDLTLINEGNPKYKTSGYVNWERIEMLFEQVEAIRQMQACCIYKQRKKGGADEELKERLQDLLPVSDETVLYKLSYRFQPKAAGTFDEEEEAEKLSAKKEEASAASGGGQATGESGDTSDEADDNNLRSRALSTAGMQLVKKLQAQGASGLPNNSPPGPPSPKDFTRSANHAEMLMEIVKKYNEKRAQDDVYDDSDESGTRSDTDGSEDSLPPLRNLTSVSVPSSPRRPANVFVKVTPSSQADFPLDVSAHVLDISPRPPKQHRKHHSKKKEKRKSGEDFDFDEDEDSSSSTTIATRERSHSDPDLADLNGLKKKKKKRSSDEDEERERGEKEKRKEKGKEKERRRRGLSHSRTSSSHSSLRVDASPGTPVSSPMPSPSGLGDKPMVMENMAKISSFYEGKRRTYYVNKAITFEQFMAVIGKRHGIEASDLRCYSFSYDSKDGSGKLSAFDEESFETFLHYGLVAKGKHSTHIQILPGVF